MGSEDIEFYMSRRYPVVLTSLTSEEGGGWFAEIKELPGCAADGETPQEAIESNEESKRLWISTALEHGRRIPPPETDEQGEYSGRLTLRMPKTMHRKVAELARREGISLNQFLLAAIAFEAGLFESGAKTPVEVKITVSREADDTTQDMTHLLDSLWPRPFSLGQAGRLGGRTSVRKAVGAGNWPNSVGISCREIFRCFSGGRPEEDKV